MDYVEKMIKTSRDLHKDENIRFLSWKLQMRRWRMIPRCNRHGNAAVGIAVHNCVSDKTVKSFYCRSGF
jgi:hypothetical protein